MLNISLQAELFINSGELLAFHKGEENPKQTAPQGTGLNQHLPAGSEKDVGDSSWGRGRGRQGTGALDQAGNCFGAELQPVCWHFPSQELGVSLPAEKLLLTRGWGGW